MNTMTTPTQIANLRASLNGKVIGLDDPRYDDARRVFFTGFDRRPAAIVRAADASDVARVVDLARETGAELAVRSGGHSRAGHGTTEGGIVLDLSAMNAVEIDCRRPHRVGADRDHGRRLHHGDRRTRPRHRARRHGQRRPRRDHAGRRHRLPRPQARAHDRRPARGRGGDRRRRAARRWTSRLTPISSGRCGAAAATSVSPPGSGCGCTRSTRSSAGCCCSPASADVITGLVAAADAAPEELSVIANILKAPPLPFIPAEQHGRPVVIAQMVYAGGAAAGERAIAPIRALATPLADMVRPIRYPEMYAGPEGPRPGVRRRDEHARRRALGARAAETILEHLETATAAMAAVAGARPRRRDGARPRRGDGVRPSAGEAHGEHRRHASAPRGTRGARGLGRAAWRRRSRVEPRPRPTSGSSATRGRRVSAAPTRPRPWSASRG